MQNAYSVSLLETETYLVRSIRTYLDESSINVFHTNWCFMQIERLPFMTVFVILYGILQNSK